MLFFGPNRPRAVEDPMHVRFFLEKLSAQELGGPAIGRSGDDAAVRAVNPTPSKTAMNERGKSDGPIVPKTPANDGAAARHDGSHPRDASVEQVEGRGPDQGNSLRGSEDRTRRRESLQAALERIRQAASRDTVSLPTPGRHDPRQEPGAVVPHAGICPGGTPHGVSLSESSPHLINRGVT